MVRLAILETGNAQSVPQHGVEFFAWMRQTGRRNDDPSMELPKIKRPRPHPRPCPDKVILAALGRASESERIMLRLGDGWTAHSLRHRYATATWQATHDLLLVSKLLGHASVETTQVYVAMPDERLRAGMAAVLLSA